MARRKLGLAVAAPIAMAILFAACGSSGSSGGTTTSGSGGGAYGGAYGATATTTAKTAATSSTTGAAAQAPTVAVGTTKYGKALTNGQGLTLYVYDKDTSGTSNCTGACLQLWPAVAVTGTPTYGTGVNGAMFTVITRADGTKQLAVNGSPLYTWTGDTKPGDATGQNVQDFYVAGADGKKIDNS